jgi:hypothetical protein
VPSANPRIVSGVGIDDDRRRRLLLGFASLLRPGLGLTSGAADQDR